MPVYLGNGVPAAVCISPYTGRVLPVSNMSPEETAYYQQWLLDPTTAGEQRTVTLPFLGPVSMTTAALVIGIGGYLLYTQFKK